MDRIRELSAWIADNLGKDTPVHMLRFHPEYKMTDCPATGVKTMEQALLTAKNQGLRYVYLGNVPGHAAENTYCPNCDTAVIRRYAFDITQWNLTKENKCPVCGQAIPIKGKLYQSNQRFPYALF
jgi:pyruvate formate lyase activating enzyme